MINNNFSKEKDVLGIIGAGQLAMMMCQEAKKLGYKICVFSDKEDSPAFDVAYSYIKGDYDDFDKIDQFIKKISVATLEFENIPAKTLEYIEQKISVYPNSKALEISQDRFLEKKFLNNLSIKTTKYQLIENFLNLEKEIKNFEFESILKTCKFGYDGKGQFVIDEQKDLLGLENIFANNHKFLLEKKIKFDRELSIIVARDIYKNIVYYPLVENIHKNGILDKTIFPAKNIDNLSEKTHKIADLILEKLDYVGVLAIEFFQKDEELLVNEFAPRPHNSGHYSLDSCSVSQFLQSVNIAVGGEAENPQLLAKGYMQNLIGYDINKIVRLKKKSNIIIHNYHKKTIKEGRKMGHFIELQDE